MDLIIITVVNKSVDFFRCVFPMYKHEEAITHSHSGPLSLEKTAVVVLQSTDVAHGFTPNHLQRHQGQLRLGLLH